VDEVRLPGLHVSIWFALFAPKQTPKAIINQLNAAVVDALVLRDNLDANGATIWMRRGGRAERQLTMAVVLARL
jgi:tripartite-type tricarboxylate transporter receptor subunit TctC